MTTSPDQQPQPEPTILERGSGYSIIWPQPTPAPTDGDTQ